MFFFRFYDVQNKSQGEAIGFSSNIYSLKTSSLMLLGKRKEHEKSKNRLWYSIIQHRCGYNERLLSFIKNDENIDVI